MGLEVLLLDKEKLSKFNEKAKELRLSEGIHASLHTEIKDIAEEIKNILFDKPKEWGYRNGSNFVRPKSFRKPEKERVGIGYGSKGIDPIPHLLLVNGVGENKNEKLEKLSKQINKNVGVDWSVTLEYSDKRWVREFPLVFERSFLDSYAAQTLPVDGSIENGQGGRYKIVGVNPILKE